MDKRPKRPKGARYSRTVVMANAPASREELAWAAGFFDGEGNTNSARPSQGRTTRSIRLSVTQIHRGTLERFNAAVGGIGVIYGPYKTKTGRQLQYCVNFTGHERVQAVLAMLWPWLTPVKQVQGAAALRAYRAAYRPRMVAQHGTLSRYSNHNCRCELCDPVGRAYYREWARKSRARKRAARAA